MARWMRKVFCGLSLALAVATGGLWVRSYFTTDRIHKTTGEATVCFLTSYRGVLIGGWDRLNSGSAIAVIFERLTWDRKPTTYEEGYRDFGDGMDSIAWRAAGWKGFTCDCSKFFEGLQYRVVISYGYPLLLFLGMAAWGWLGGRGRRRRGFPVEVGAKVK